MRFWRHCGRRNVERIEGRRKGERSHQVTKGWRILEIKHQKISDGREAEKSLKEQGHLILNQSH